MLTFEIGKKSDLLTNGALFKSQIIFGMRFVRIDHCEISALV